MANDTYITPSVFGCNGEDYIWLSTGRSAISFVLGTIEERNPDIHKIALLPSFTCNTVIEPFIRAGYTVYTLPISERLCTSANDVLLAQKETGASVVLIHRYYGFDTLSGTKDISKTLSEQGAVLIEDITQCLYSNLCPIGADYLVGSIRKWTGVPDGGFATCKTGHFRNKPVKQDNELQNAKRDASVLKYRYIYENAGIKQDFIDKYRMAEELLDNQKEYYTIGQLSMQILGSLDANMLKTKRRNNYKKLAAGLSEFPDIKLVFAELSDNVTPLYCPIYVEKRAELQIYLGQQSIYAPIVWPKAGIISTICSQAEVLYNNLLCLPIDQRYDESDINRVVKAIKAK